MPVLRPLVGFNKEEILAIARQTGVFDLSAAVGEYCDLVPAKPATRALLPEVLRDEAAMRPEAGWTALVAARTSSTCARLDEATLGPAGLETDRIDPEEPRSSTCAPRRPSRPGTGRGRSTSIFQQALEASAPSTAGRATSWSARSA